MECAQSDAVASSQSVLIVPFTWHPHLRGHSALPEAQDGKLQLTGLVGLSQLISVACPKCPTGRCCVIYLLTSLPRDIHSFTFAYYRFNKHTSSKPKA